MTILPFGWRAAPPRGLASEPKATVVVPPVPNVASSEPSGLKRVTTIVALPFTLPAKFPVATQNAARVFWWLEESDPERAANWARHCLRAYFTRGTVDLSNAEHLKALGTEFGLDAAQAERVWTEPRWKSRLKTACDDAIAQGVFGAPFFVIDGEPFWGNDRRDQIERWLAGGF